MVRIIFRCRRVPRLRLKLTPNPSKRIITKNELRLIKLHSKLMKRQQKCIPKMKKWEKSHKFGPWANLPEDLWQKIMELMSTDDQFRSTSVCKDWHSAITRIARSLELSYRGGGALFWEFYYRWETSVGNPKLSLVSQLNDPSSGGSFDLVKSNWNCKTKFAFGANPVAQKNGWFLFAKKFQWKSYFFLYHVFSKRTIWLPALKYFFDIATFSSKALPLGPECQSDCVIFASYRSGSGIYIATYKIGDENWEIMLVATAKADDCKILSVVYGEEKNEFYYVFSGGILGKFALSDRSWSLISRDSHGLQQRKHHHLFQYEGELMLMVKNYFFMFHIFRFDWSVMKWILVSGIDSKKGASFMDFKSFFCKNRGNGEFLFVNLHYLNASNVCWIDPPSLAN